MVTGAMARSRWIAVLVLGATFIAGATLGAASSRLLAENNRDERAASGEQQRTQRRGRTSIFDQIDLSAEQKAAVDSIMENRRREMDAFWKQHNPEVRAIIDSTRTEIDRVLTPEQRQKFEEFRKRREQQRREWERQGGTRPPASGIPMAPHGQGTDSGYQRSDTGHRAPGSLNEQQLL